jgi:Shugoshin C terminus
LKEQLEAKLSEVGTLITELGTLPEKAKRRSSQHQRRKSGLAELAKSPDQKDWKNRQTIGGVVAGERQPQEGRLPVIVEGKHYPRKTLESLEISRIMGDETGASDSPELGPPPVAHFDVAEPIEFVPHPPPAGDTVQTLDQSRDHEEEMKPLPDNLETRRRRRASALIEDMSTLNGSTAEVSNVAEHRMSLKSGAKRKLDVREHGYREESGPSELDDFAFQRKGIASEMAQARAKGSRFTKTGTVSIPSSGTTDDITTKLEPGARKVLAPKSTNSPSKSRRVVVNDKVIPANGAVTDRAKSREPLEHKKRTATAADRSTNISPPEIKAIALLQEPTVTELQPKTPAGLDLFSPVSTELSARIGQQTEVALSASVEDVLGGTDGRTSRRARSAVSYAEPSLRAKMRRPTKELVAAVVEPMNGFKGQQRESSARAESQERQPSQELSTVKMRTVTIKREQPTDGSLAWKSLPEAQEEPPSPLVNRMAKSSSKESPQEAGEVAGRSPEANTDTQHLETALDSLTIFDGPGFSPHDSPNTIAVQSRKTSRRHSSNPVSLRKVGQEFSKPAPPSDRPQSKNSAASTSDRPPRPSSAASLRKENLGQDDRVGLKRSASVTTLKSSAGTTNTSVGSGVHSAAEAGRTERAAARRRSMMI